ncbi:MAG: preprotein translocase subunit SecG [Candidatus Nealsonbacteria bacterium]
MKEILLVAQIVVAGFLVILILLQQRGSSLGSAFGGTGEFYAVRRGMEQKIFWATVIFGIVFVILALFNLVI